METVTGQEIRKARVVIGQTRYVDCTFVNCEIVFSGTPDVNENCRFMGCELSLDGPAVHTLQYLRSLWENGAWNVVEKFGLNYAGRPLRFTED